MVQHRDPSSLICTKFCVCIFLGKVSIVFSKGSVIHKRLRIITVEANSIIAAYVLFNIWVLQKCNPVFRKFEKILTVWNYLLSYAFCHFILRNAQLKLIKSLTRQEYVVLHHLFGLISQLSAINCPLSAFCVSDSVNTGRLYHSEGLAKEKTSKCGCKEQGIYNSRIIWGTAVSLNQNSASLSLSF